MSGLLAGQYIPGHSLLHRLDARAKLVSLLLLLTAVVASATYGGYALLLGVLVAIVLLSKLPLRTVLASIGKLRWFFVVIFLMNALFYGADNPLLSWWIVNLTPEGMKQGAKVVFNVFYVVVLANVLMGTTAPMETTAGMGSLLKPLRLFRVPVEEVAMVLSIALRFIPTLLEDADFIKKAQTARGARFESKKLREKASSFLPLLVPTFLSAFRRAEELSTAMESRGYRNARNRTPKARKPLKLCDFAALTLSFFICVAQIYFMGKP